MKLPAYGKALLAARRSGHHPAVITVIYGEHWDVEADVVRVAVKPGEALGRDWRCVLGLPIEIEDRFLNGEHDEQLRLAGEIAHVGALVMMNGGSGGRYPVHVHAFLSRRWDKAARRMQWPHWWSEEIDQLNFRNRKLWLSEAEAYLAQLAA